MEIVPLNWVEEEDAGRDIYVRAFRGTTNDPAAAGTGMALVSSNEGNERQFYPPSEVRSQFVGQWNSKTAEGLMATGFVDPEESLEGDPFLESGHPEPIISESMVVADRVSGGPRDSTVEPMGSCQFR